MLGFLAYRFNAVRTALADGRLSSDEFRRNPQGHLMGPRVYIYALGMAIAIVAIAIFLYEKLSGHYFGAA